MYVCTVVASSKQHDSLLCIYTDRVMFSFRSFLVLFVHFSLLEYSINIVKLIKFSYTSAGLTLANGTCMLF